MPWMKGMFKLGWCILGSERTFITGLNFVPFMSTLRISPGWRSRPFLLGSEGAMVQSGCQALYSAKSRT